MSKKRIDDQQKEEAWSRKFDDEGGFSEGNYSRTARKKAKGGISPILTTLCVFLALLIILPISVVWWYSNNKDVEDTGSANDQVT
ncbi:MAG: LysM domain-containing protein, partial [Carnobacterium sp.]